MITHECEKVFLHALILNTCLKVSHCLDLSMLIQLSKSQIKLNHLCEKMF